MLLNPNTTIIIGPPGTGKTGRLIEMAKSVIQEGCDPEYVGYISFTRQAVKEASARIQAVTGHPSDKFIGFKTLHAMIYWLLGLDHANIITDDEFNNSEMPGLDPVSKEQGRIYSYMYNYHRVTGMRLEEVWEKLHTEYCGTEADFLQWVVQYNSYKAASKRIDFTDMVESFHERQIQFPFTHLFIDEAQDFTPDQWAAVALLARFAGHVYVAGDSDQAIFEWAGASGNLFNELEGERIVLDRSHRVPILPHTVAKAILREMGRDILYAPTEAKGRVRWIFDHEWASLPFDNGESWYILARNKMYLEKARAVLYDRGIHYQDLNLSSRDKDRMTDRHLRRILWYEEALENIETLSKYRRRELEGLTGQLDASLEKRVPWHIAFQNWPIDRIQYYLRTRPHWHTVPKVQIGTFHSAKGAEAKNVILIGDCTRRVAEAYYRKDTAEYKVLYVAVTRTKGTLYLVQPTGRNGIPWHLFIGLNQDLISEL